MSVIKTERLRSHRKRCNSIHFTQKGPEDEVECDFNEIAQLEPESTKRPKTCQSKLSSYCIKNDAATSNQLDLQIARFFYACNIPFNVAEHKEFKAMVSLLRPGYNSPNRKDLSGRLLDNVHGHIRQHIAREIQNKDVTLMGSKSYFLNAVDTGANNKNASYCATLFLKYKTQAEEEFKCRTVGIVTDNEKKIESMRRKIIEFDNTLVTCGCSSHLLNVLGQDITPPNIMSQVNEVSKYFRNHHTPGTLLSEFSNQGALKPQTSGAKRWNSQLQCIRIFNKNRPFYLMFNAQHEEVIETRIVNIMNNIGLSNQAKYLQDQLEPISIALNTLQSDSSSFADACHSWLKLTKDELLHPYKGIVHDRFNQAMTPYHFLAFCSHPKFRGKGLDDEHLESVHQLIPSRWQGVLGDLCSLQAETHPFPSYMFKDSFFENVDPCVWWLCIKKQYKSVNPKLSDVALHLLNLLSSSASIERIFSNFSHIQTKLRNRIGIEKASKLITCFRELRG